MAEIRRGREWSHPPWEPCALATMQEGPYMRASMSRSVLVFPRSPFLLFLRFKRGLARAQLCIEGMAAPSLGGAERSSPEARRGAPLAARGLEGESAAKR